jgi:hypothetical protein
MDQCDFVWCRRQRSAQDVIGLKTSTFKKVSKSYANYGQEYSMNKATWWNHWSLVIGALVGLSIIDRGCLRHQGADALHEQRPSTTTRTAALPKRARTGLERTRRWPGKIPPGQRRRHRAS